MIIIIPCAGYGTRLAEVTKGLPKALIDICGQKLLTRTVTELLALQPSQVFVVTNNHFFEQFKKWKQEDFPGKKIEIINDGSTSDETRIGTLKDIALTFDKFEEESFLIYLGDNLVYSKNKIYQQLTTGDKNNILLHDLNSLEKAKRFGTVIINENQKLIGFEEKPEQPKSSLISTGIYYFQPFMKQVIQTYIKEGNDPEGVGFLIRDTLKEIPYKGIITGEKDYWFDIGTPEAYYKTINTWENL